jgi:hypothetical protein
MGYDCSPAAALRETGNRDFALPFDWVVSSIHIFDKCFEENFEKYHTQLKYTHNKKRLIDAYGFQFPHDYPLEDMEFDEKQLGEGVIGEENGKYITKNWPEFHEKVKEKYNRRVERFIHIVNDSKPIVVLCRYSTLDVLRLQKLFVKWYKKENVFFINSTTEKGMVELENKKIFNIYTEKNGIWNESAIWKECIEKVVSKINN